LSLCLSTDENVVHLFFPLSLFITSYKVDLFLIWTSWILSPGWTKIEGIDSLVRKIDYDAIITESLRKWIHLTRYQSTLFTMHYGEYVAYVKNNRSFTPTINCGKHHLLRPVDIVVAGLDNLFWIPVSNCYHKCLHYSS